MTRLVVAEIAGNAGRDLDIETAILGPDVEVKCFAYTGDDQALVDACIDADVILTDYVPFTGDVISQLNRCRLISVAATGYSTVDVAAAAEADISVCALDEYCTDEVADHTLLLILALCRRLRDYDRQVQIDHSWQFDSLGGLRRLHGMTLGIVGFGKIGRAVARRASGFGLGILAHDPLVAAQSAAAQGVRLCELAELLADSDIITLHCNVSSDNRHLIDSAAIRQMKKRPILINCARGALIEEDALVEALESGAISAAGLDVLEDESPNLQESRLIGRNNVIVTPHAAFYSDESILENRRLSAQNIRRFLDGDHAGVRKYVHRASA